MLFLFYVSLLCWYAFALITHAAYVKDLKYITPMNLVPVVHTHHNMIRAAHAIHTQNANNTDEDKNDLLKKVINVAYLDESPFGSMHSFMDFSVYALIFGLGIYSTGIMVFVGYLMYH
jgi:hypothetical protein